MSFKIVTIYIMSIFYIQIGIKHFTNVEWFMKIMPPYLPYHKELVYLSGIFEIIFGLMILFEKTRFWGSWGLILLLLAVYPANIYLAFNQEPQELIGISSFAASWIRLPIQFILIGIAYWHSKTD